MESNLKPEAGRLQVGRLSSRGRLASGAAGPGPGREGRMPALATVTSGAGSAEARRCELRPGLGRPGAAAAPVAPRSESMARPESTGADRDEHYLRSEKPLWSFRTRVGSRVCWMLV